MTDLLRDGEVDVAFDTVFPALSYSSGADAKLLLREWRDGAPNYRSILFKRKDTPIHDLADLVGRTLAFERPGSTTAYFVPKAELMAAGLQLRELKAPKQPPPPGSVGYVFAGSENNLVVWVHRGLVEAGAFSDIDWEQSEDMPPELKDDFEIFLSQRTAAACARGGAAWPAAAAGGADQAGLPRGRYRCGGHGSTQGEEGGAI